MKVVIVPLNKYFYDFNKFDGSGLKDRIEKKLRHAPKWLKDLNESETLKSFTETKVGSFILKWFIAFPVFLIIAMLLILPLSLFMLFKYGRKNAVEKRNQYMESVVNEREDILKRVGQLEAEGFKLIIYYNKNQIPTRQNRKDIFYNKIEKMKLAIKPLSVIEASEKLDILNIISHHQIETKNLMFVSDGNILMQDLIDLTP